MEIRFMAIGSERGTEEREMGEEKSKYRSPLPLRTCPPPRPPLTSSRVLVKGWIQTKRRGPISVCWEHLQLTDHGHSLTNSEAFWRSGKNAYELQ